MWKWLRSWWTKQPGADFIDKVQQLTMTSCRFVPTAGTIAAIVTGGSPAAASAATLATAICSALKLSKAPGLMYSPPMVGGVEIEGTFLDP